MFWHSHDFSRLIHTITRHIEHYEKTKWFWQSNQTDIDRLKQLLATLKNKNNFTNQELWLLFTIVRQYVDDEQDEEANKTFTKIRESFPYYNSLLQLESVSSLKHHFLEILSNVHRSAIIEALISLQDLNLFHDPGIRSFAIDESVMVNHIINIFGIELDQKLFQQLIMLHTQGGYLFEDELRTLAAHPEREALFQAISLFYAHHALPRDRHIFSNILAHQDNHACETD